MSVRRVPEEGQVCPHRILEKQLSGTMMIIASARKHALEHFNVVDTHSTGRHACARILAGVDGFVMILPQVHLRNVSPRRRGVHPSTHHRLSRHVLLPFLL